MILLLLLLLLVVIDTKLTLDEETITNDINIMSKDYDLVVNDTKFTLDEETITNDINIMSTNHDLVVKDTNIDEHIIETKINTDEVNDINIMSTNDDLVVKNTNIDEHIIETKINTDEVTDIVNMLYDKVQNEMIYYLTLSGEEKIIKGFVPRNIDHYYCIFLAELIYLPNETKRLVLNKLFNRYNREHFPRYFLKDSRLSFTKLTPINDHQYCELLHQQFFDKKNHFLHSIHLKPETVVITKIEFGTGIVKSKKNIDRRIQIRWKNDSEIFRNVSQLLVSQLLYDPKHEIIEDISLLIGGTTEQDFHCDNARMFSSFVNENSEHEVNYEINRKQYNTAVMSKYGHCSIMSGFDDTGFRICVPTSYVNVFDDIEMVSIKYGKLNDMFPILKRDKLVSDNHDGIEIPYVTIKVPRAGCQFVGDFIHAGANNVEFLTRTEQCKFKSFYTKASELIDKFDTSNNNSLLNLLKNCPILYKVSRFFATIIPIEHKTLIVDTLNVGMFGKLNCDYVDPPNNNEHVEDISSIKNNNEKKFDNMSIIENNNNINDIVDSTNNHDNQISSISNVTTRAKKQPTKIIKSLKQKVCKKKNYRHQAA